MTDDTATPDPTPSSGGRWRVPVLVAALVLAIVVVVALATRDGDDDIDPAAGPAEDPTTSSASPSESTTATSSPTASDSPTANDEPVPSPIIDDAVRAAMADRFPAMVPAGVPAGWTVQNATYSPKQGGIWRIDLTDPNGAPVQVVQSKTSVEGIVREHLGADAQQAGQVNLSGTGKWSTWSSASQAGVAREISDTAVLVAGPDQDTVVTLAEQLLTAEDAGTMGEG
jgi:hypothetical protein